MHTKEEKVSLFISNFSLYMKQFIFKLLTFCLIIISLIVFGFYLPATPRDRQSLLFSQVFKDSLLNYTPSPRIILIGGSNLSMGINSFILKKDLKLNPINTSIHAAIGLKYMMHHTFKFLKKGDIIILSPEYQQFYGSFADGREELLRVIADIDKKEFFDLQISQISNILKYIPSYCLSKFKLQEYYYNKNDLFLYGSDGYNIFGDYSQHWQFMHVDAPIDNFLLEKYNPTVLSEIQEFNNELEKNGCKLFITFPGYQKSSFTKHKNQINFIYNKLISSGTLKILGNPLEFVQEDSLMYGTSYHLTKRAIDKRTYLFMQKYKNFKN